MAIEVGGGLVAKLEQHKKNLASRAKTRAHKKMDKRLRQGAYAPPDGKVRAGYSPEFAEGWGRIFEPKRPVPDIPCQKCGDIAECVDPVTVEFFCTTCLRHFFYGEETGDALQGEGAGIP